MLYPSRFHQAIIKLESKELESLAKAPFHEAREIELVRQDIDYFLHLHVVGSG